MPGLPAHASAIARAAASSHRRSARRVARSVVRPLPEVLVEPAARVLARLRARNVPMHFPVVARHERADLLLALDQDRERRRLHAADGGQLEAAGLRIERRHRARAVDADQPVGLGAANRRIGERPHLLVAAQPLEAVADRRRASSTAATGADRLVGLRVLRDVAEDQLAFAARVARVDEAVDVLALDEPQQRLEPRSRSSRSASARTSTEWPADARTSICRA